MTAMTVSDPLTTMLFNIFFVIYGLSVGCYQSICLPMRSYQPLNYFCHYLPISDIKVIDVPLLNEMGIVWRFPLGRKRWYM